MLDAWDERFLPQLQTRVAHGSGKTDRTDLAAVACLVERAPQSLSGIIDTLAKAGKTNRLIEIALTLSELRKGRSVDPGKHVAAADAAAAKLPQPYRSICTATLAMLERRKPRPTPAAVAALRSLAAPSDTVRLLRLKLDEHLSTASEDDVRWALGEAAEPEAARLGIEAAGRLDMANEINKSINHRYAHVAACAITWVARPLEGPLPAKMLHLAGHRTSPVRLALSTILEQKPHPAHQPALMRLVADRWSRHSQHYGRDDDAFPDGVIGTVVDVGLRVGPEDDLTHRRLGRTSAP